MPEWLWPILVGGVVMGLIGIVYRGVLTKHEHAEMCGKNTKDITDKLTKAIRDELKDMKVYFDLKIENVILKEIRKKNGH